MVKGSGGIWEKLKKKNLKIKKKKKTQALKDNVLDEMELSC